MEPTRGLSVTPAQQRNRKSPNTAPGGARPLSRCLSLDLEVARQGGRIRAFAGVRPDGGEVDAIISIDIVSEGQNLQQAQEVLSFDMPWNPQRVVQRNGRTIRLRSPHDTAYLDTLRSKPGDLNRLLRPEAELQAKIMAANASVGMETPVLAEVETESQAYTDLNTFVERLAGGDATLLDEQRAAGRVVRLRAVELRQAPESITWDDLGVVCYQVVLPD